MPVLSVYFGSSSISFLYANSPKEYKFFKYPYVYSKNLFGHFVSEIDFYTALFDMIYKDLGIDKEMKSSSAKLLFTSFPHIPLQNMHPELSVPLNNVVSRTNEYFAIFVDECSVINPSTFFYAYPLKSYYKKEMKNEIELNTANYYSNLSVFPQAFFTSDSDRLEHDNYIRFLSINSVYDMPKDLPIMLCGDRFSDNSKYEPLTYLLAIDLIKDPGIFQVKMDLDNIFPVLALLTMHDPKYSSLFLDQKFWTLGTLINSPGMTECLIERESGPSQFVDVKPNELFFIPMEETTTVKLQIKNAALGTQERFVSGGKLGLIIDTRPKNNNVTFTEKYISKGYREWQNTIKQILNSLSS